MARSASDAALVREAWIGDAVLALWARLKILKDSGEVDGELSTRLTSNQFLAAFGEPTKVEAAIGRVYREKGIDAAFQHIELQLLPLWERQQRKAANKRRT